MLRSKVSLIMIAGAIAASAQAFSREENPAYTSALGKSDPPLLSRNDPGILTGRSGPNTAARDEDYETSRCQRPGRDRALSAAGGSGRAREWEPGNGPAASRSAKQSAVKERKR